MVLLELHVCKSINVEHTDVLFKDRIQQKDALVSFVRSPPHSLALQMLKLQLHQSKQTLSPFANKFASATPTPYPTTSP